MAKGLKIKVRKFLGQIPTFAEVTEENLVGGTFLHFSIKDLLSKYDQILSLHFPTNLVTFTEETINGKLYFFVQRGKIYAYSSPRRSSTITPVLHSAIIYIIDILYHY